MKAILIDTVKANAVADQPGSRRNRNRVLKRDGKVFSVSVPAAYCCRLSFNRLSLTALFISAATTVMTYWM